LALVEFVKRWAVREQAVPAQIALAWLMAQESWIIPIPGRTKMPHFLDNFGVDAVQLTPDEVKELNAVLVRTPVHGALTVYRAVTSRGGSSAEELGR
jgi:aryl-alcohol dehydrogenase-like predicted oxidoreductase